jgi:hypothetical protein
VDGDTTLKLHLPGKPAPDTFLEAARRLSVSPERAVVVEDAIAGVQAGRAGSFGLVVGVDRDGHADELAAHGADIVVADLGELLAASTEGVHRAGPRNHRLMAAARRIVAAAGDYPADPWRMVERVYNPSRALADDALRPDVERVEDVRVIRTYRTARSGLAVAAGMDHEFDEAVLTHVRTKLDADRAHVVFDVHARPGQTATLTKWLAYHYGSDDATDLANRAGLTLHRAHAAGYAVALAEHEHQVSDFWARSEVVWEGQPAAQQTLHFSLFSIMQASLRSEGHGIPAKGLTGTGYEGHYFWDTEAYVLPFLIHTSPNVARSLLMHRVHMLPDARRSPTSWPPRT